MSKILLAFKIPVIKRDIQKAIILSNYIFFKKNMCSLKYNKRHQKTMRVNMRYEKEEGVREMKVSTNENFPICKIFRSKPIGLSSNE